MMTYKQSDFLTYMSDVQECNESISKMDEQWNEIKLLTEINCPRQSLQVLPNMIKIQKSVVALKQELIEALILEKLKKMEQKIVSKTQVAIDILIRNLFERTADIGFLATDSEICRFVENEERSESDLRTILSRMHEYVAKYSVYEDIIVLDTQYQVLANLDEKNKILGKKIKDQNLIRSMNGEQSYLEYYEQSKLQYGNKKSHVFSSRIYSEGSSRVIGLICLCFRFEDEMSQILEKLTDDDEAAIITIIDDKNNVIASSNKNHVPIGIAIEAVESGQNQIVYYCGSRYIAKTVMTKGYQNYFGLGWRGHVMLPLKLAFGENTNLANLDSTIAVELMQQADSFSQELNEIVNEIQTINHALKRIVYNGQIMGKADSRVDVEHARLTPILRALGRMGTNIFQSSVANLFQTVIATSLDNTSFLAALNVEIMDRNLYERANDCRWWALDSTIRGILSKTELSVDDQQRLTDILSGINALYTVYSNLFVFDKTGVIIAVSNPERLEDIGKQLSQPYITDILANTSREKYFVSPFEKTELYDNQQTYIYGASIIDINNNQTVGGIGIVFDSAAQFETMLKESLNTEREAFAVFTDRKKRVIASTNEAITVGKALNLSDKLFAIANGKAQSEVLVYKNSYYSVGYACSSGYREYKRTDGYDNAVIALMFEKIADYQEVRSKKKETYEIEQSDISLSMKYDQKKLATFAINGQIYGLEQSYVIEALEGNKMISVPETSPIIRGVTEFNNQYYAVVDILALFDDHRVNQVVSNLLMLQLSEEEMIAIQVESLGSILEINLKDIQPVEISAAISGIICLTGDSNRTILEIDPQVLLEKLFEQHLEDDLAVVLPLIERIE
ncbi:chemotaxis protein CheW [Acetobacterium woodii]|uniref:Chemotaxis protein CheW6 n=1 Tax=Acetobacterium woodii (strain ATCC 29683 / DSM 1030 / JCM 2381 / KCTC 1655 / WB1) TaxID=931626 RepID=H6LJL8_ACEWD|nr:chemotaxis protein CheW [Acetobacterium woodii]AFA49946.1 chemotaxis protein CheW6 [Acetobacterium woodii DSM 1030]